MYSHSCVFQDGIFALLDFTERYLSRGILYVLHVFFLWFISVFCCSSHFWYLGAMGIRFERKDLFRLCSVYRVVIVRCCLVLFWGVAKIRNFCLARKTIRGKFERFFQKYVVPRILIYEVHHKFLVCFFRYSFIFVLRGKVGK